ncbi:hypothetical protein [Pontibacter pamirensis]|uniref:hypothetical protein n=1 Tax=Pontibacter pamirensis TaxID=2562824 RepID=UPI0013897BFF|nr:hypothetical protein [Pontibacter pamirensis]
METPLHKTADEAIETAASPAPTLDQHKLELYMHRLSMEQRLVKGILAGLLAAVAGAVVWAVITVITGYQIGYMAVAISFAVGYVMRTMGQGIDKVFGVMGALLALLGCVLGNFLGICGFVAEDNALGYLEVLQTFDYSYVPELMVETFSPMDVIFYGIALYQGYKMSFRHVTQEELLANASTAPVTFQL